ncbi:MAG: sugar ABC transporter substrate-binding protein [Anaerolineae bacterium]|nr:sugar ABC transporter substrate-binding protein [Anaerolineae bacterium]MDW8067737.1 sugar ABC transporter substrate-binding protein [Anaerolineae bacterium]
MKRLTLVIGVLILIIAFLFGCARPERPAADVGVPPKIILRVGTGDSGEGLNPHQEIIARFENENADILVQLEAVAGRDYYTRLLTQIAAKDAPDIMQIGDDAVPMFASKGALLPLEDYIKGTYPLDTQMYLPGVLDPGRWEGKLWLLPKDFTPLGVYYNKKIFDQFGVAYPQDGWTWTDLLQTAQALTRDVDGDGKTDIWGIQLTANWTTGFEYWVAAAGGRLISEDGKRFVGYMDSPETIAAVQFFADLYNKYKVAPPPADFNLWAGGNTEFENGKAAMRIFGRWPQARYRENPNLDLGLVGVPAGKVRANILFWSGFGIFSGSKHPEAAWRFLRFYAGKEGSEVWKDWAIPPVASVAEAAGLTTDSLEGVWIRELNFLAPRAYVFTPYWNETADPALRKALETVLTDPQADVAAVMKRAAQEAQAALDEKLGQ